MNEKWNEYQAYLSKKESGKKPRQNKEEPTNYENIQYLPPKEDNKNPLPYEEQKIVEEEKELESNEQGLTEEEYERLYKHYLELQKNNPEQITPSLEPDNYKNKKVSTKNYQDPNLCNASQKLSELNKHNQSKKQAEKVPLIANLAANEKNNHFDNKNLDDFNLKKTSVAQTNKENVNSTNENEKSGAIDKKKTI